jgi:hypothetical protein
MTSTELQSEEKEDKMLNFTTNVPEIDKENENLFRASELLESTGNTPGLTANEFYALLIDSHYPVHEHESLALAAIAIETMMNVDQHDVFEPTVH